MKSNKKPSISKLVTSFDNQLKRIIMNDLKAIKAKTLFLPTAA
ncbi:hypothetical protein SNE25_30945 [Mucilaginibacter sabulilitoris]|uniref:Transposase n=1 Tax=Mucilaginibacter sabulilitoris TaxID=1173583 RepID=A0ABZ0TNP6_9SPHI|nr:hypothetical protein [Mucilaginibacter sabulilitoris]WPU93738.1 hypothetical protein SNE25_30945 [Mucilaginibacter sabulilitoris]